MLRLAHEDIRIAVPVEENTVPVLVIEDRRLYRECAADLYGQQSGIAGKFVLSEEWEPISIEKTAQVLFDLFSMECNDRKLLNALYKQLGSAAVTGAHAEQTMRMRGAVAEWMAQLEEESRYPLTYSEEPEIASILKMLDVRFEDPADSILERLARRMCLYAEYLHTKLFIGIGLRSFFSDAELEELYTFSAYQKLPLLLLENTEPRHRNERERLYIVDKDLCELYHEEDDTDPA